MKKNSFVIFIFAAALCGAVAVGCRDTATRHDPITDHPGQVWLRSYVMGYYEPVRIIAKVFDHNSNFHSESHLLSMHVVKGETVASYLDTDGPRKDLYDVLCRKHNDMTYNRYAPLQPDGGMVQFPDIDITNIIVTCDRDFNAEHPAGTPLNDLLHFCLHSPMPYILSGYDPDFDAAEQPSAYMWSYIEKDWEDLDIPDDFMMLGSGKVDDVNPELLDDPDYDYTDHLGLLVFREDINSEPDVPGIYNITVTFETELVNRAMPSYSTTVQVNFAEH